MKKVRLGLIGTGIIAHNHCMAMIRDIREAEVTALCDVVPDRAEAFAREFGLAVPCFTDYREMITSGLVDAVSVITPNDLHCQIAAYALEHGMHVFCEKPVGLNADEVRQLAATADKYPQLVTLVGFNNRYIPAVEKIAELVASGALGRITHFKGKFYADRMADVNHPLEWRHQIERAGSGTLGDLCSHLLDLGIWLIGDKEGGKKVQYSDATVFVPYRRSPETGEMVRVTTEDACNMVVRYDSGTDIILESTRHSPFEISFTISGFGGGIKYDFNRYDEFELLLYDSPADYFKQYRTVKVTPGGQEWSRQAEDRWSRQYHYFFTCILNGQAAHPSVRDSIEVHELMDEAKRMFSY